MSKFRVHKEGKWIILINLILWLLVAALVLIFGESSSAKIAVTCVALFMATFMLFFFRIPDRNPELDDSLVFSPADGKVVNVTEVEETEYFNGPCKKISVFLSFFNVHITWFPVGGSISYYKYHPGKYIFAFLPKSSVKNEHTTIVVKTQSGSEVMFRQIAGIVARRIVCYASQGANAVQASEAGFIKFGSRLDIFVPTDAEILVKKGDKVRGQLSALAKLN
ncbi:MAG: phosphatidylserine decarboxylase family protein [Bacteroidales bacterium]|nr:phosphatidylserine decarboxylase family protein [Bacteroidales bacterium]